MAQTNICLVHVKWFRVLILKSKKIYCFPLEMWHLESMYALDPSQIINQHLFRLAESVIYNTNLLLNVYIRWHNHNFSLNSYILTDNPIQKREKYIWRHSLSQCIPFHNLQNIGKNRCNYSYFFKEILTWNI